MALERVRLRHDWDPAPPGDCGRFIIRDRTDGEPGVAVILADGDNDYRTITSAQLRSKLSSAQ